MPSPEHRPLFDRLHELILEEHPDAALTISYGIPTYRVGRRRLYLGVWKRGVSLYGWEQARDGVFTARHPELTTGKGTIQLTPANAAGLVDDELRALVRTTLSP
ncbi:MAG: iron chaperone [Acidimicrobiales bacterium]